MTVDGAVTVAAALPGRPVTLMPTRAADRLLDTTELFHRERFHAMGLEPILAEVGVTQTRTQAAS